MEKLSPSHLSFLAKQLFAEGSFLIQLSQRYRPFICPFEELIMRVPAGSHVLDVGCGGGLFLGLLLATRRISFGHGFDSSPQAIAVARAMAARTSQCGTSPGSLVFEHRSVRGPWPSGQFDVVSIVDVMHHVAPTLQPRLLKFAFHHIKPGGLLLYKDIAWQPQWRATANRLHDFVLTRQCIHYAPIADVQEWAKGAGLQLIESRSISRLWYGHELCVFRRPYQDPQANDRA
jgi:2-polyprenyl-3-methyl-5-hydroxy-6-metoxy-1,4-benzoquinol methylase